MEPRVSVLIPCRDPGDHLEPLLRSWLDQEFQDFELLLVDDASSDDSVERARALCGDRLRIEQHEEPLGLAANWNRCVQLARAPYLVLAHQDDVYLPGYLLQMLAGLEAHEDAAFVHCHAEAIDDEGRVLASPVEAFKRRFWDGLEEADRGALYRRLYEGNFVCCPSVLYRREVFDEVGGFREDLRFTTDWDFSFRVLRAEQAFVGLDETLLQYRRHRTSATRVEAHSLNRYVEEKATLELARQEGVASGLLGAATRSSPAVRNNLLFDVHLDLVEGRRDAARDKLAWGRRELEGFGADPIAKGLGLASRLGPAGGSLSRLGLALYLRLAARGRG